MSIRPSLPATLPSVPEPLRRRFAIDARALAALRIALGSLLLLDLVLRARHLTAFYTDAGVLPRAALTAEYPVISRLSVHTISGSPGLQAVLFVVAGVAAVALVLGYRTRLATAVSLLLLISLHARNPVVLNGGDSLLRRLVLWGLLLPLGERWSLDAVRRRRSARDRIASLAAAGILLQVVVVYLINAALKLRGDAWLEGTAVRYVFELEQFVVLLGEYVQDVTPLLTALTWLWLALVLASPLLVLATGWLRALLVAAFATMHVGMLLTMQLGIFPLVAVAALLPFLPPVVWDRVERRLPDLGERSHRLRPLLARQSWGTSERHRRLGHRLATLAAAALLVFVAVWSPMSLGYVDFAPPDDQWEPSDHSWDMFAPSPPTADEWFVAVGTRPDGTEVDAFHGGAVEWDPPDVSATYPTARWRKYLVSVRQDGEERLADRFAEYLCERRPRIQGDRLASVTVTVVVETTRLDGPDPTERRPFAEATCGDGRSGAD